MSLFRRSPARPHLWSIKLIGVLAPRRLRADWRQEWEAELRHREALLAKWDKLNWQTTFDLPRWKGRQMSAHDETRIARKTTRRLHCVFRANVNADSGVT